MRKKPAKEQNCGAGKTGQPQASNASPPCYANAPELRPEYRMEEPEGQEQLKPMKRKGAGPK